MFKKINQIVEHGDNLCKIPELMIGGQHFYLREKVDSKYSTRISAPFSFTERIL